MKLGSVEWILKRSMARRRKTAHAQTIKTAAPIYRIAQKLGLAVDKTVAEYGLLRREFEVLQTLLLAGPNEPLSHSNLFQALLVTSGGVTKILERLLRMRLVKLIPDPNDGRRKLYVLSEKGRTLAAQVEEKVIEAEYELLGRDATDEEIETLSSALISLANRIEN